MEDVFSFINIWRTNSIQVLNLHDFFCRFWFCHSKHILEIYLKNGLGTGRFLSEIWIWIWIDSQQKTSVKSITLTKVLREGGKGLGAGTLQLGQLWLKTGNGLSFCYAGW